MEQNKEAIVYTEEAVTAAPKKSKAWLWVTLAILTLLAGGYAGVCAYAQSVDTFYPNYAINGVEVAGLTTAQAQQKLEDVLTVQQITLVDQESGEELAKVPLMDVGYDVEDFAGDAQYWMGELQKEGFLQKGWTFLQFVLGNYPGGSNWPDPDAEEQRQTAEQLAEQLSQEPIHADYRLEDQTVCITKAKDGRKVTAAQMSDILGDAEMYRNGYRANVAFSCVPAEVLTAQEVYDAISGEMKNATYDAAADTILPEQVGVEFNVAAAQAALNGAEPGEVVPVEASVEQPAVTAEELKEVLFRDVLGEWKTHVSGTAARINNVKRSAASIHEFVMNTGDVFSYNEVVGKRTAENGYQAAPAYVRGETVDEIGGGICQTSSTLYYACLLAQVEIVERYPHRYVPAYIPWGMDATVSWGGPDYKFSNNSLYPIKIVTEYSKNYLTVKILGTKTTDTTVKMTNQVISTTPWVTVYEVDETLAPGTPEKVKTTPYTGYKVQAYRNLYDGEGKLLSSTLESTNNYKVRNQVIVQAPPVTGTQVPVVTDPATGTVQPVQPDAPAFGEGLVVPEETPVVPPQPPVEEIIPVPEQSETVLGEVPSGEYALDIMVE